MFRRVRHVAAPGATLASTVAGLFWVILQDAPVGNFSVDATSQYQLQWLSDWRASRTDTWSESSTKRHWRLTSSPVVVIISQVRITMMHDHLRANDQDTRIIGCNGGYQVSKVIWQKAASQYILLPFASDLDSYLGLTGLRGSWDPVTHISQTPKGI